MGGKPVEGELTGCKREQGFWGPAGDEVGARSGLSDSPSFLLIDMRGPVVRGRKSILRGWIGRQVSWPPGPSILLCCPGEWGQEPSNALTPSVAPLLLHSSTTYRAGSP